MKTRKAPHADAHANTRRSFEYSLIASLLITIALFMFFPHVREQRVKLSMSEELVTLEAVEHTRQEPPPPPPKPMMPVESPSAEALPDTAIDLSSELDIQRDVAPPVATPNPPREEKRESHKEDYYFEIVEDPPVLIGGLESIRRHLVYPDIAVRAGVQGTVTVLAYVDRNGTVNRVEILRGIGGGCDEAAVAAVEKVKFVPARQRGKTVNVKVSIPVRFRLADS